MLSERRRAQPKALVLQRGLANSTLTRRFLDENWQGFLTLYMRGRGRKIKIVNTEGPAWVKNNEKTRNACQIFTQQGGLWGAKNGFEIYKNLAFFAK